MTIKRITTIISLSIMIFIILISSASSDDYLYYNIKLSSVMLSIVSVIIVHPLQINITKHWWSMIGGAFLYALLISTLYFITLFILALISVQFENLYKLTNTMMLSKVFTYSFFIPSIFCYLIPRIIKNYKHHNKSI